MSNWHVKYLLIGGGLASSAAAEAIRRRDPRSSLLLVGQEVVRPYHRPPLSKDFLLGHKRRADLFTLEADWFSQNQVDLKTGMRVVNLDAGRRCAALDNGQEVSFDQALIAIGVVPRHLTIPGADYPNVQYLRSLQDAERLQHLIHKAKTEGRAHDRGRGKAAVIGGGLLGVEVAASLTQLGLEVSLICAGEQLWSRFAGEPVGKALARHLERHGVGVHVNQQPLRLEGDGRAQRVALASGETVECDFVVAAVGVSLNKELLRGTPILVEKAILTDDHCRTNLPGIYAAGDCAAIYDPLFGKHRRMDHWDSARGSGALAGENMAGGDVAYKQVSWFSSQVFDWSIEVWGEGRLVSHRLLRGAATPEPRGSMADAPELVEIGIDAGGQVAQVIAVNPRQPGDLLRELVVRRVKVEGHEELLKDPTGRLQSVLEEKP